MNGWFPRINAQTGAIASGAGDIFVSGRSYGSGHLWDWFDGQTLLVKGVHDFPTLINVPSGERRVLRQVGTAQAAGGGGVWMPADHPVIWTAVSRAGERAWIEEYGGENEDRSLFLEGRPIVEHQPIHWCRVDAGHVTWSHFARGRREVWGCRPGGHPERLQVFDGDELSIVPVVTPSGPWILVQTHLDLRVAPWGGQYGTLIATGNDENFDPDAAWTPGGLLVAWYARNSQQIGARVVNMLERTDLRGRPPAPVPVPPTVPLPPESPTMPDILRDRTALVLRLRRELFPSLADRSPLPSRADALRVTNAVALALADEGWGLVKAKAGSENDVNGYTCDVIAQRDGEHVDVLEDGGKGSYATWQPVRFRDDWKQSWNDAIAPRWAPALSGAGPAPGPAPAPGGTHAYDGGGNDTGECDVILNGRPCMQPATAPIHNVTALPIPPVPGTPVTAKHPLVAPILAKLAAVSSELAAIPACPPAPEPHVCPPCPPCELPHGGPEGPGYAEMMDMIAACQKAYGRKILPADDFGAHLVFRFLREGFTVEQLVAEAEERGR